jgi:hypothetical protein
LNDDWERLGCFDPNVKIALCLDMTETCFRICIAGIRARNPGITDEALILKLQERIDWIKRPQERGNSHGRSYRAHKKNR